MCGAVAKAVAGGTERRLGGGVQVLPKEAEDGEVRLGAVLLPFFLSLGVSGVRVPTLICAADPGLAKGRWSMYHSMYPHMHRKN